ncbi:MAG: hypothetical protein WAU42_12230 [Solirubrobacteraceae bacterium]
MSARGAAAGWVGKHDEIGACAELAAHVSADQGMTAFVQLREATGVVADQ